MKTETNCRNYFVDIRTFYRAFRNNKKSVNITGTDARALNPRQYIRTSYVSLSQFYE